jgi:hypothetical protein
MIYLVVFGTAAVMIIGMIYASKRWGKVEADRNTALKIAAEKIRDAEITSGSFVDDPLDKL